MDGKAWRDKFSGRRCGQLTDGGRALYIDSEPGMSPTPLRTQLTESSSARYCRPHGNIYAAFIEVGESDCTARSRLFEEERPSSQIASTMRYAHFAPWHVVDARTVLNAGR